MLFVKPKFKIHNLIHEHYLRRFEINVHSLQFPPTKFDYGNLIEFEFIQIMSIQSCGLEINITKQKCLIPYEDLNTCF